jgi:hypothetical protein
MRLRFFAAVLGVGLLSPSTATAQTNLDDLASAARALKPGQYLWRDLRPEAGEVSVIVSLGSQLAFAYRDGQVVGIASVSTGTRGHRTPEGSFTVLQKRVFHRSNLYSNAPMPHMQRLTWDGIALHAGHNPGYPASHGCIRLPPAFAALLFGATRIGSAVDVISGAIVEEQRDVPWPTIVADASVWRTGSDESVPDEWVPDAPLALPSAP